MEPIKILFFALASFFGNEDSRIVSEKATIRITPVNMTIEVLLEDLFTVIITEEDKATVEKELKNLIAIQKEISKKISPDFTIKQFVFSTPAPGKLNATIQLQYKNWDALKDAGMSFSTADGFTMINIEEWHLKTTDGKVNGNYIDFDAKKPFSFTIEPFGNMPEEYKNKKTSLRPLWEQLAGK